ncbi:hypothetical protein ACE1OC_23990 [Streptomyces sp. DSM 116496]|uniref:hypothetical protein n=1 Tax=Streptomyces stoeckheimensis TaxID=3344656 RepID=UPI0038B3C58E
MSELMSAGDLAAMGAAALVAEMARSTWQGVRDAVARFFGSRDEEGAAGQVLQLDAGYELLSRTDDAHQPAAENALRTTLGIQLEAFLRSQPEAAAEFQALIEKTTGVSGPVEGSRLSVRGNTNSQIVVSGGSITGNTLHYRPEAQQ